MKFLGTFPLPTNCGEVEAAAWKWKVDTLVDIGKDVLVRTEKV